MNLLLAFLFSSTLKGKKVNVKRTARNIRRDTKFLVQVITELVELTQKIIKFIFKLADTVIKKCFCQKKTVEKVKLPENVIDLEEYRLKKAE